MAVSSPMQDKLSPAVAALNGSQHRAAAAGGRGETTGDADGLTVPAGRSQLGLGVELVEGLGGLGEGVGEGLVPVHVGAAGTELLGTLFA